MPDHQSKDNLEPEREASSAPIDNRDSLSPFAADDDPYPTIINTCNSNEVSVRYRKVREHASGGLGVVFLAHDSEVDRNVALKEIKPDHSENIKLREAFRFEAHVTGRLEHPGVVPIYGLGEYADGRLFYAMRFIRGITLTDGIKHLHELRLKNSASEYRLQLLKLLRHFIDTCNVMHYAHSQKIIHRDLKPHNIMLGGFGETLVVDWGLAKSLDDNVFRDVQKISVVEGTIPYMGPEQAKGNLDEVDCSSDNYSLGATLYHLLSGDYPGKSIDPKELLSTICQGRIPELLSFCPWVPKPLSAICAKAMANQKEDRYSSAADLAHDVERWLADEPIAAYRDTFVERSTRWLRHHRSWTIAGAISIMTVALVSSIAFWRVNLARQAEKHSRDQATELYGMARHATDDLLMAVSDRLRDVPSAELVRRELLQQAAKTYSDIIAIRTEDVGLREQAAIAAVKLGEVQFDLADFNTSIQSYAQARAILEALAKKTTDREKALEWKSIVGKTYIEQSRLESRLGLTEPSKASAKIALQTLAALATEYPKRPRLLIDQSNARIQQGNLEFDAGNLDEAAEAFLSAENGAKNAIEISIDDDATRIAALHSICRARTNYAHTLQAIVTEEKPPASEQTTAHRAALAAAKRLIEFDRDGSYVNDIATAISNYGNFLLNDLKEPKLAIELFKQSIDTYQEAVIRFPDVLKYRVGLVVAHNGLGDSLADDGQPAAALAKYNIAISMGESLIERNASIGAHLIETSEAYRKIADLMIQDSESKPEPILKALLRAVDLIRKLNESDSTRLREVMRELMFAKTKLNSIDGLAELTSDFLQLSQASVEQPDHHFREAVTLAMVAKALPSQAGGPDVKKIADAAITRLKTYLENELQNSIDDREIRDNQRKVLKDEISEQPDLKYLEQVSPDTWKQLFEVQ